MKASVVIANYNNANFIEDCINSLNSQTYNNLEIIFFDEPTTGLDPIMTQVINNLIRELVVELGVTAITITHDIQSVRSIADEVAFLHNGIIQWTGFLNQLDKSNNKYLKQFIAGSTDGPIGTLR